MLPASWAARDPVVLAEPANVSATACTEPFSGSHLQEGIDRAVN